MRVFREGTTRDKMVWGFKLGMCRKQKRNNAYYVLLNIHVYQIFLTILNTWPKLSAADLLYITTITGKRSLLVTFYVAYNCTFDNEVLNNTTTEYGDVWIELWQFNLNSTPYWTIQEMFEDITDTKWQNRQQNTSQRTGVNLDVT